MSSTFQSWEWTGVAFRSATGVPLSDRGFRYGMAIFESIAIRRTVEFLDEHLGRLRAACDELAWPIDPAALDAAAALLTTIPAPAFARVYITAGDGGPTAPIVAPRVYVISEPRAAVLPESYRVCNSAAPYLPAKPGLKTANYWPNIDAFSAARASGEDEALLFNPKGELVSASMANVFAVTDGQVVTPHTATGARPGVVREWIMQRRSVSECFLQAEALANATELFLASSWIGIMPVRSWAGRSLDTNIATTLRSEFFA